MSSTRNILVFAFLRVVAFHLVPKPVKSTLSLIAASSGCSNFFALYFFYGQNLNVALVVVLAGLPVNFAGLTPDMKLNRHFPVLGQFQFFWPMIVQDRILGFIRRRHE